MRAVVVVAVFSFSSCAASRPTSVLSGKHSFSPEEAEAMEEEGCCVFARVVALSITAARGIEEEKNDGEDDDDDEDDNDEADVEDEKEEDDDDDSARGKSSSAILRKCAG